MCSLYILQRQPPKATPRHLKTVSGGGIEGNQDPVTKALPYSHPQPIRRAPTVPAAPIPPQARPGQAQPLQAVLLPRAVQVHRTLPPLRLVFPGVIIQA